MPCAARRPLGRGALEKAEGVLARFDVVLIAERLDVAAPVVAAALGFRDPVLEAALQAGFSDTRVTHADKFTRPSSARDAAELPKDVLAKLRSRNRLDRELYARAFFRFYRLYEETSGRGGG